MRIRSGRRRDRTIAAMLLAALTVVPALAAPAPAQTVRDPTSVFPLPNPEIEDACGLDVTLLLDASGSISAAGAVEDVREASSVFLDALADTNSTAGVVDFGTVARQTAAPTQVTSASVSPAGVHGQAIDAYYNPIPPLQPGVDAYSYTGGNPDVEGSYTPGDANQFTNWDQALDLGGRTPNELLLVVTDGEPSALDSDQPGDPFYVAGQDPPNVRYKTDSTGVARGRTLDRAIEEANQAKSAGTRVLVVGVGEAFDSAAAQDRLIAISGPQVVDDAAAITDINSVDVALVPDFEELGDALRRVVVELCTPSVTIRKLAQSPEDSAYLPTPGWTIGLDPGVDTTASPPYTWRLPAGAPPVPQQLVTDDEGYVTFQWDPNPGTAPSLPTVTEVVQPGYTPVDYECTSKLEDGTVVESSGPLDPDDPTFDLEVPSLAIVTCTLLNDFDYEPGIDIEKANSPTLVRGDPPGTTVTSTYTVTNPGNTSLAVATPTDDQCNPVTFVGGDADGDNRLDVTETWTYTCDRVIQAGLTDQQTIVDNTVEVIGTDPEGTQVSDDATATVEVITPDIEIVKTAGDDLVPVGTDVTYTYEVRTNGNTPLEPVTVTDDTCASPSFDSGDTNGDGALDPGETWVYTCTANITEETINIATAVGTPEIGPEVTDDDDARIDVTLPDMTLTKVADQEWVVPGTQVAYTFEVTNTGTAQLRPVPPATRADWITDTNCSPQYSGGDVGDDSILAPGETWTYVCTETLVTTTRNLATVVAEEVGAPGNRLTRLAPELVRVLTPAVDIDKRASDPVVYDGDSVTYTYEVTNPGQLPLDDVAVTDDRCSPLTLVDDGDGDGVLQPGELWVYTCTATLTKSVNSPNAPETVTNTVDVEGTPALPDGTPGEPVVDDATASVEVIDPSISLEKVADRDEVRVGETVVYTVTVTNTGDSPLAFQSPSDTDCSPLEYQSGDVGDDGIADVGEAWVYTCSDTLLEDRTNTAEVIASDILGGLLEDQDEATVTVYDSGIALEKTVDPRLVPEGEQATYTFVVTNTATDPLTDVQLTDTDCGPISYVSGDGPPPDGNGVLDPGESWTYECTANITSPILNTAVVAALDHTGAPVMDTDYAYVVPFRAGIDVVKTATPTDLPPGGGEVTYTYDVTNTGNVPLADVASRITDDTCSPVEYVSGDDDGNDLLSSDDDLFETGGEEVWRFECTTTVTEDTTNTVVVEGTPVLPLPNRLLPLDDDVSATDQALVTVAPAPPPTAAPPTTAPPTTIPTGTPPGRSPTPGRAPLAVTGTGLAAILLLGILALAAGTALSRRSDGATAVTAGVGPAGPIDAAGPVVRRPSRPGSTGRWRWHLRRLASRLR